MGVIKSFEEMTLKEIERLGKPELIKKYHQILSYMKEDELAKMLIEEEYGKPIQYIEYKIVELYYSTEMEDRSNYFFPGKKTIIYPSIKYHHAKKELTCFFSGARIGTGSLYISYRPMLKTIEDGNVYVLTKTIKVEPYYEWDLPRDIGRLEELNDRIANFEYYDDSNIHYDQTYYILGGKLVFRKLKRRRKI